VNVCHLLSLQISLISLLFYKKINLSLFYLEKGKEIVYTKTVFFIKGGILTMNSIKFIEIGFENVESIVIPVERMKVTYGPLIVHSEVIEDFKLNYPVYRTNLLQLEISFSDSNELTYDPQKEVEPLGMFINNPMSNNVVDRPHILGRILNYNDIVNIDMLDENEEVIECIYAPWGEEYEEINSYMTTHVANNLLTVHIEKT